ncbi:branched-chain amino acid ABC transporter permease [Mangrovihabitans endophyticus]|uniref:Branched-chain amino acid ABC transporter permease n=1 Tax=Mangrovihabitans endophyticus TaxID=1751298 RepID=A0A8J3C520_9ACTN|nr:branched-chain amino acid ABC transporter permease [Mangrovihabitans endophyticus]GGL09407.1 branched-chain amino acid ABC transporter permease [Mangrovihabitans endophyticus]
MTAATPTPTAAAAADADVAAAPLRGRGLAEAGRPVRLTAVAVLAAALLLPLVPGMPFYYLQIGVLIFWYATLGTSWTVAGGYGGMHSIGHAAFVGVGAYTSTLLYVDLHVSPWLGMLAGMALAAGLAVLIGWPCFRFGIRGDYFALVTVALGQVVYEIANGASFLTGGAQGVPLPYAGDDPLNFQFETRTALYYVALVMWLVTLVVAYRIRRSGFGFELIAVRDDEIAAARGGIDVSARKLLAFATSAAMAAAAGTFYAQFILFIDPGSVIAITLSVQIVLMSVLGGMNSYLGGTVGAILLVPLSQYLSTALSGRPGIDLAIYGVVLVLLMLYLPAGILGTLRGSRRWRSVIGW